MNVVIRSVVQIFGLWLNLWKSAMSRRFQIRAEVCENGTMGESWFPLQAAVGGRSWPRPFDTGEAFLERLALEAFARRDPRTGQGLCMDRQQRPFERVRLAGVLAAERAQRPHARHEQPKRTWWHIVVKARIAKCARRTLVRLVIFLNFAVSFFYASFVRPSRSLLMLISSLLDSNLLNNRFQVYASRLGLLV